MLESLKKEAKRWLQALRTNDAAALARFARAHPHPPSTPTLRDVQLALARERGFAGWTDLKAAAATAPRDSGRVARTQWFLENACPDHHVRTRPSHTRAEATAMRVLSAYPEIAHDSFCTEVVCGNLAAVDRMLADRPSAASTPCEIADLARQEPAGDDWLKDLGQGWPPLLYLCSARLPLSTVTENAVAIATKLLDAGADPNVFFMAGSSKYTSLVAAVGEGEESRPPHPRRDELVRLLLDRGAEPYDIQVVYNIGFRGDVLWFLRLIYARSVALGRQQDWDDPEWRMLDMGGYGSGARWHLDLAIRDNNVPLAEWCLAHGAIPNAAPPRGNTLSKRSLYEEAQRRGQSEMMLVLERHGADVHGVAAVNAPEPTSTDAMFAAAKRNDVSALRRLLDSGVSPDVAAPDNTRPLHIAARADAAEAVQLLITRGAEIDPVETTWGGTPIGTATYCGSTRAIDALSPFSREIAALTFNGKVERVRELVEADPSLARTTADGDSLLLSLPRDVEERAIAMARLLLRHGADPAVTDSTGRTPADRAERLAMFDLARLLRSAT